VGLIADGGACRNLLTTGTFARSLWIVASKAKGPAEVLPLTRHHYAKRDQVSPVALGKSQMICPTLHDPS